MFPTAVTMLIQLPKISFNSNGGSSCCTDSNTRSAVTIKRCGTLLFGTSITVFLMLTAFVSQTGNLQYENPSPLAIHVNTSVSTLAPRLPLVMDWVNSKINQSISALDLVHAKRREATQEACRKLNRAERERTSRADHQYMYYDPDSNALYCFVPKVGCSNWKKIFSILLSKEVQDLESISGLKIHNERNLQRHLLSKMAQADRPRVSRDAFSFMFARDPFRRVFSAYCDKVFMLSHQTKVVTREVRLSMGQTLPGKGVRKAHKSLEYNLTFAEVLEHVSHINDFHFWPISSLCNPCFTSFNVLGRMETFDQDTDYILDKLNGSHLINRSVHTAQFKLSRDLGVITELVQRTFSDLPSMRHAKYKFLVRMWKIFHIRGLVSDAIQFPLNKSEVENIREEKMASIATQALVDSGNVTSREAQRDKYYRQAFRSVPLKTLERFSQFAHRDCIVFGYECKPPDIFQNRVDGDEEENIFSSDRLLYKRTDILRG